jgi:hypothetical protein
MKGKNVHTYYIYIYMFGINHGASSVEALSPRLTSEMCLRILHFGLEDIERRRELLLRFHRNDVETFCY